MDEAGPLIPAAEMERMMKVQEVILRALAGKLKWWEAAEILGVTDRTMRRWRDCYEKCGYDGLYDYRKRQPSPKRMPLQTVEKVLALYRDKYFDCNVRHFHEKLQEVEGVQVSYTWVKLTLQDAGRWKTGGVDRTAGGARGGRCRACCCISTAAPTPGFRTGGITT